MFWIGQVLVVVAGLVGIALVRAAMQERFSFATDSRLDWLLLFLLLVGVALGVWQYLIESAESRVLAEEVQTVMDYSDVARLTFNGSQYTGGDFKFNSRLTHIMEGTFREVAPNRFRRVCTDEAMRKYETAIRELPRFPFSYYWYSLCLKDRGDDSWMTHAETALAIFERTTQIAGHQKSHDRPFST